MEILLQRASASSSNNGRYVTWIDGVQVWDTGSTLDNYDALKSLWGAQLGAVFWHRCRYFWYFSISMNSPANDTGDEIGPIPNSAPDDPNIDSYNDGAWTNDNTPTVQFDLTGP